MPLPGRARPRGCLPPPPSPSPEAGTRRAAVAHRWEPGPLCLCRFADRRLSSPWNAVPIPRPGNGLGYELPRPVGHRPRAAARHGQGRPRYDGWDRDRATTDGTEARATTDGTEARATAEGHSEGRAII